MAYDISVDRADYGRKHEAGSVTSIGGQDIIQPVTERQTPKQISMVKLVAWC